MVWLKKASSPYLYGAHPCWPITSFRAISCSFSLYYHLNITRPSISRRAAPIRPSLYLLRAASAHCPFQYIYASASACSASPIMPSVWCRNLPPGVWDRPIRCSPPFHLSCCSHLIKCRSINGRMSSFRSITSCTTHSYPS